jgi:hypothetical protein
LELLLVQDLLGYLLVKVALQYVGLVLQRVYLELRLEGEMVGEVLL